MERVQITEGLTLALVVQDHAEEAVMDLQLAAGAVIIDKAKIPELIHEMTDPRPRGTHHLRKGLLIDPGNHRLGRFVIAKPHKRQEDSRQALLARIENMSQEIFSDSGNTRKKIGDEEPAEGRVLIDRANDSFPFHAGNSGLMNRRCARHPQ